MFKFALRVEPEDFRAFAIIMALGNRKAAADFLKVPHRSFYDRVEAERRTRKDNGPGKATWNRLWGFDGRWVRPGAFARTGGWIQFLPFSRADGFVRQLGLEQGVKHLGFTGNN